MVRWFSAALGFSVTLHCAIHSLFIISDALRCGFWEFSSLERELPSTLEGRNFWFERYYCTRIMCVTIGLYQCGRFSFDFLSFFFIFLSAFELEDLQRFTCEAQSDAHTVVFRHHPVVLINALEVLGYRVISSFNVAEKCVWTMRREFPDPEPSDDE